MHIHILGICGTFMGGLAALAREAGHRVTGCDANVYPPMSDQLRALGIELIEGFGAEQLALKPDLFVVGNVVSRGNALMEAILNAGAAYTSGPQWLSDHVLQGRHVLAVAGTHGKTTTTSMLAWILDRADIFENLAAIERQFHHLVRTVPGEGRLVVNAREESLQRVLAMGCWSEVLRFGARKEEPGALRARGEPHAFDVLRGSLKIARVEWALLGEHNQLNALAAIAAAEHVGVAPEVAARALASFENVRRRLELRGEVNRIKVYDDFAHHPTAMRTTVNGLRRKVGTERILAVFEPRSNTMKLGTMKAQLPWSLEEADLAFCHSGGLGWNADEALAPMGAQALVCDSIDKLVARVVAAARPGDHILCMSNGGFGGIHAKLLAALAARMR
jgi:UDP-N-acetylmuramate: L-alanyl-gamma-D-glutamyl-meso-diaminopimelate ligase